MVTIRLINLGCGARSHPDWTNLDLVPRDNSAIPHDIRKGIPFANGTFDVVYHSHLIEHLRKTEALIFLQECHRVLKTGGIIRIATPDLERIVRIYIQCLDEIERATPSVHAKYDWILLEMYDQATREIAGGEMLRYLSQNEIPNREFVIGRVGPSVLNEVGQRSQARRYQNLLSFFRFLRDSRFGWEWLLRGLLGRDYEALLVGRFRRSGEVHHWMYDRYSLKRLLLRAGFTNAKVVDATTSAIPNWNHYALDALPNGEVIKPDSLFIEAVKP